MPVIPIGDTVDRRPEVLPPGVLELFDDRFVRSWDLYEAFTRRLAARIAQEIGMDDADPRGPDEIALDAGLDPARSGPILAWLAATLSSGDDDGGTTAPAGEPDAIRHQQLAHDPAAAPAYDLAVRAAEACPAVMRGEISGEEVLLAPDRIAAWSDYFSNDNPLYAINNRVGALGCLEWAPTGRLRVLEVGGGLGSGADALLEVLDAAGRLGDVDAYRFTDLSVPFVRRGMRALQSWMDRVPLSAGRLDLDRPFAGQGVEPGSVDLIWAVNTLHVAHDLEATLRQVRTTLAPGGVVVLGECVRPFDGQPVAPEMIFNLLESFRSPDLRPEWRPNGGFLTAGQWAAGFRSVGLDPLGTLPDIHRVREHYPSFVVAAVGARRPA